MNYKYSQYVEDNAAIHNYDYTLLNRIDPYNHTDDVIRWVTGTIDGAIANAQNVRDIDTNVRKYNAWKNAILAYLDPKSARYGKNWGLVCAAYGSAVEEYINIEVRSISYPHSSEFLVILQKREEGTIPDIRISLKHSDKHGNPLITEVAWLDVTSEKSICHIHKKKGSGWDEMPIVAEIVYPPLKVETLLLP